MKAQTIQDEIFREFIKASGRFPAFNSAHEGYAVILEEVDEFWEEVKKNPEKHPECKENMRKECTRIAAMCLRFLHDL